MTSIQQSSQRQNLIPQAIPPQVIHKKDSNPVGPTMAGLGTDFAILTASTPLTLLTVIPAMKKAGELGDSTIKELQDGVMKALKDTKLDNDGVNIKFLKQYGPNEKISLQEKLMDPINSVKSGINAFFLPKDAKNLFTGEIVYPKNTILVPERDLSFAIYHELGHAHNFNRSKIGRILQKSRPFSMYAPLAIAIYGAMTTKSKAKDGKELSSKQKLNNSIRDNAGKLSLICTLPMLIEEGMATAKGQGWANKYLSPANAKKVFKGNAIAYTSYLITAGALALGSYFAVKVKDKLFAKKEAEQEQIYQAKLKAIEDYNVQFAPLNPEPHTSID